MSTFTSFFLEVRQGSTFGPTLFFYRKDFGEFLPVRSDMGLRFYDGSVIGYVDRVWFEIDSGRLVVDLEKWVVDPTEDEEQNISNIIMSGRSYRHGVWRTEVEGKPWPHDKLIAAGWEQI